MNYDHNKYGKLNIEFKPFEHKQLGYWRFEFLYRVCNFGKSWSVQWPR